MPSSGPTVRPPSGFWPSLNAGRSAVDNRGIWRFPDGSVLVRTVSIEQEQGQPASRRRMETQILHLEADAWRPYSYVWNADQTDATLAEPGGSNVTVGSEERRVGSARRQLPSLRSNRVRALPQPLG